MAKSRYKKMARAYGRRKQQTRRIARNQRRQQENAKRQEEAAAAEARQKRQANLFQNILGITAAVGYNENVLPQALAISKATRSNYLTNSLLRRAQREKIRQAQLSHEKANPLHEAVVAKNVNAVRALLEQKKPEFKIDDQRWGSSTALEIAISKLNEGGEQEDLNRLKQIIQLLLDKGAKVRPRTMMLIWSLPNKDTLNDVLQTFPRFRHLSLAYKDKIWNGLERDLQDVRDDMNESRHEFHRPTRSYGYIPDYMYDSEANILTIMDSFYAFVETYNHETGEYSLELSYPNYEVMSVGNQPNVGNQANNNNRTPVPEP